MHFIVFIFAVFLLSTAAHCKPRSTRQISGFYVLSNNSIPCVELLNEQPELSRVELTDSDKIQLMSNYNIDLPKAFTALTKEEALDNFPCLLPLESEYTDRVTQRLGKRRSPTKRLAKQDITDFLINYYSGKINGELKETKLPNNKDGRNSGQAETEKVGFRSFLQRIENIKDTEKRTSLWQKWMEKNIGNTDSPLFFPEMMGIPRETSQSDGTIVQLDFCQNRGSLTPDLNHVRMCTVCSATRTNPEGTWPPYVNEAVCSASDSGCLIVNGESHGSCQQIAAPVNMLRKQADMCTLVMKNGDTLIADQWDVITELVNVGCECNILLSSIFAMYV